MMTPDPKMYPTWQEWARQVNLYLSQLEEQIRQIRAALDLDAGGPS